MKKLWLARFLVNLFNANLPQEVLILNEIRFPVLVLGNRKIHRYFAKMNRI
jgi:hypothetical protein